MRRASSFFIVFLFAIAFIPQIASANVLIHVRYQDTIAFEGEIDLPEAATTTLSDSIGNPHEISSQSSLYLLSQASASTSSKFSITDLQYYDSFGAFYVNCIDIATTTPIHACGNWQYAVNGNTPFVGSDKYIATTSDDIYFYYGNQRQFSVSATSTDTVTPIIVTAEKYDFATNSWSALSGTIVDATQPDPDNPWSPFIISSSTTNENGTTSLSFANAGVYNVGLRDDGYYPTTITVASSTPATNENQEENNGGGFQVKTFNVDSAIQFLVSQQKNDSSFGDSLYTDWVAIALGSRPGQEEAKSKLRTYYSANTNPGYFVTDYERRAMALMALGIDPYSGTSVNYIKKITDSFDGEKIFEQNREQSCNDEIFALFPLLKAGHTSNDDIIQKITQFIISNNCVVNQSNGTLSWGSVDMTAAAIQALSQVSSLPNVSSTISKAEQYLKNTASEGNLNNSFAASWMLQAVPSIGQNPLSLLTDLQQVDGGVELLSADSNNRIWATSYAIPAVLGKPWPSILSSFPKPAEIQISQASGSSYQPQTSTSTIATTTSQANTTASTTTVQTIIHPKNDIVDIKPVIVNKIVAPMEEKVVDQIPTSTKETQTATVINSNNKTEQKNNPLLITGSAIVILGLISFWFVKKTR